MLLFFEAEYRQTFIVKGQADRRLTSYRRGLFVLVSLMVYLAVTELQISIERFRLFYSKKMRLIKNIIKVGVLFTLMFVSISCNNDEENKITIQLEKKELTITVSSDRRIRVIGAQQESFVAKSENDFIASVTVEGEYIRINANHVGETKVHISLNDSEDICSIKCVPENDWISGVILDFGITRGDFMEAIKGEKYIDLSGTDSSVVIIQRGNITYYETKTTYFFDSSDKLSRIKQYFTNTEYIDLFVILHHLEDYYEYVRNETSSHTDRRWTYEGIVDVTTTRHIYKYPNKGYVVYHLEDYTPVKTGITRHYHTIYYSVDEDSAKWGF